MKKQNLQTIINTPAFFVALGIIIFALVFLASARGFSNQGKYVEVKGLSERVVKSDRAIWSLGFDVKSNDVSALYSEIDSNTQAIENFLKERGFTDDEISTAPVNVYQDTYQNSLYRYNASVQMSVYTDKVDLVRTSSEETLPLIKQGIIFNNSYINFEFTDINAIKPEMLQEAIANAQVSAEQFADNANAKVNGISRANQGVFSITEKDPGSPEYKNVRVVSTLRFMLK